MAKKYDYDESTQLRILSMLFRDGKFLREFRDIIKPQYFDYAPLTDVCRLAFEFYDKYKKTPSYESFINYTQDWMKGAKRTKSERDAILLAADELFQIEVPDPDYIRDIAIKFAKTQQYIKAVERGLKLAELGRVEEAVDEVNEVNKIGLDNTPAINYFKKIHVPKKEEWEKFYTGLKGFDFITGGIKRRQYGAIVTRTNGFKTGSLVNIALAYAKNGLNVFVSPNEQDEIEYQSLMDCSVLGITQDERYEANKSRSKIRMIRKKVAKIQKLWGGNVYLKYFPYGYGTVNQIASNIEQIEAKDNLKIDGVLVDSLDGLSAKAGEQFQNEVEIYHNFEGMLGYYKKWGWTTLQMNIKGQGSAEKNEIITHLSQLRGRADKAFLAGLIVGVNIVRETKRRDDHKELKGFMIGLKSRNTRADKIVGMSVDTDCVKIKFKVAE